MPLNLQATEKKAFLQGFVKQCLDKGLSREATEQLLQKYAADTYTETTSTPGSLGGFAKNLWNASGTGRAINAINNDTPGVWNKGLNLVRGAGEAWKEQKSNIGGMLQSGGSTLTEDVPGFFRSVGNDISNAWQGKDPGSFYDAPTAQEKAMFRAGNPRAGRSNGFLMDLDGYQGGMLRSLYGRGGSSVYAAPTGEYGGLRFGNPYAYSFGSQPYYGPGSAPGA